jgi:hypothetical protein
MITIGVTGHRFLVEVDKITARIDQALDHIEKSFGDPPFQVISALAEGADRLVVRRVLARGNTALVVSLPLPKEEYLKDFQTQGSQEEFLELLDQAEEVLTLPPAPTREESYASAGYYLLDHCQVLIAIWDGQKTQGVGGTGEIAVAARRRKLPLAWIQAGNRVSGTEESTSLGDSQGRVIYENFPGLQS